MSIRFVFVVTGAILASALFAWYVKGDLEMGWLAMGPIIVGFSVLASAAGSLLLPGGFPRVLPLEVDEERRLDDYRPAHLSSGGRWVRFSASIRSSSSSEKCRPWR